MSYARLVEMGKDLASRERARGLREQFLAEAEAKGADRLTFDFEGVRTLSDSFADELLAVLVEQKGEEWFREKVKLVNLSDDLRLVVLEAIHSRISQTAA